MALWWCALFGDVIKLPVLITSWDTGVPPEPSSLFRVSLAKVYYMY